MENWEIWIKVIYAVVGALVSGIPLVISLIAAIKKFCKAKAATVTAEDEAQKANAEADAAQAKLDLMDYAKQLVVTAENTFAAVNSIMKSRGESAGSIKKEVVMAKLQSYATENGYEFNSDEWSSNIDELVTLTREVNAK